MSQVSQYHIAQTATGSGEGRTMKYVSGKSVPYCTNCYWTRGGDDDVIMYVTSESVMYYPISFSQL